MEPRKIFPILILVLLTLSGCVTPEDPAGMPQTDTPQEQEDFALKGMEDSFWQIQNSSPYYQYFNQVHRDYQELIRAAETPEEKRSLYIQRDLKIARERLNHKADKDLVKEVIGSTQSVMGTNDTGHIFRKNDIYNIPRQHFSPSNPEDYQYEPKDPGRTFRGSDAMTAIIQFDRQLKKRGVQLIVVPVPNSSQVYLHRLHNDIALEETVWHPWAEMMVKLLEHDIEVIDLLDLYKSYSGDNTVLNYIDHHWGQAGLDIAAKELSHRLSRFSFDQEYYLDPNQIKRSKIKVDMPALIPYWDHLDVGAIKRLMPVDDLYDTVRITYQGQNILPAPFSEESPVLLMGDSFIPHLSETSSGIYAHLAYHSRIIPQAISKDAGAAKPPQWYRRHIANRETEPQVVIWEIYSSAMAEVNNLNDWMVVNIPDPEPHKGRNEQKALKRPPLLSQWVEGTVVQASEIPSVEEGQTYPDALYSYQLEITNPRGSELKKGEIILIQTQYLDNYKIKTQSIVKAGDERKVHVEKWDSAAQRVENIGTMQIVDTLWDFDSSLYYGYRSELISR